MKRLIVTGMLCCLVGNICAQGDVKADTLKVNPADMIDFSGAYRMENVRNYDGFLLDMNALNPIETPMRPFSQSVQALMPDYSRLFQNTGITYSTTTGSLFTSRPAYHSLSPIGIMTLGNTPTYSTMQVANFRLRNGMTFSTIGDYDEKGVRVNRPINPWQRNNFQGAFQLKSADGKFSFQVHVQQGR